MFQVNMHDVRCIVKIHICNKGIPDTEDSLKSILLTQSDKSSFSPEDHTSEVLNQLQHMCVRTSSRYFAYEIHPKLLQICIIDDN